MPAALAKVKRELGPEAVILHTRTLKRGGLFGFGAKQVVEVTASADVNVLPRDLTAHRRRRPPGNHGRVLRQTYAQDRLFETSKQKPPSPAAPKSPPMGPQPTAPPSAPAAPSLAPPPPQNAAQLAA